MTEENKSDINRAMDYIYHGLYGVATFIILLIVVQIGHGLFPGYIIFAIVGAGGVVCALGSFGILNGTYLLIKEYRHKK